MGSHRPRHRGEGRRTSLVGDPDYDECGPGPAGGRPGAREAGPAGPGESGTGEPADGGSRTSLVGAPPPGVSRGEQYVEGDWPRVWHGEYRPAGHTEDTVVLGDFGGWGGAPDRTAAFGRMPAFGRAPESGRAGDDTGAVPPAGGTDGRAAGPWYRQPQRLAAAAGGLALVAFTGFLLVPAILSRLGIGTASQSGLCPTCQFPIPSSSAAPASPASPKDPKGGATPAMRPVPRRRSQAPMAATRPAAPQQNRGPMAGPGTPAAAGLGVFYNETAQSGGGFLAQVTVVNHGDTAVSGWQLVLALPFDSVSGVANAQGYDEDDVLFLQPAASDPSIAPGGTLVVAITASGPTTTPVDCSFDGAACQ